MEIVDLSEKYENTYCNCLEDWSDEMKEAGNLKREWLEKKKNQGLRVKLARNDRDEIVGMIHYIPIENAPVNGTGLYYIYCVWVHGHKKGAGDWRKKGIGTRLLEAAENDARELGAKGMAAWGITLPFFMRSAWFRKHGYARADKDGTLELVWKRFDGSAVPPSLVKEKKRPAGTEGTVSVTCFRNGWCPAQNIACERMKRAVGEYGGKITYREIDTDRRENFDEWGICDAIFVDDKQVVTGPPPSYAKLQKILKKRTKGLTLS